MNPTNTITASAPGKLILFGEHAVVHGHPCIVTAVDQRLSVTVRQNGIDVFHLDAPDLGLTAYSKTINDLGKKELPKGVRFIEHLYKRFLEKHPQERGIIVTTKSEFPSTFGFGSSSAVTVAFAKALTNLYGLNLSNNQLFDLCYQAVLDVQGVGSGFDIAAAIWGGTLYYVKPAKVIKPININALPVTIGYTGVKADTPTLIRYVHQLKADQPQTINAIFQQMSQVTKAAKQTLENQDWTQFGELMDQNQALLKKLQVSSVELENLIAASKNAKAQGAKLSGAGGGDCMVALTPTHKKAIQEAITQAGGKVIPVSLNAPGVRLEKTITVDQPTFHPDTATPVVQFQS